MNASDAPVAPTEIRAGELADDVKAVILQHTARIDALAKLGDEVSQNHWTNFRTPRLYPEQQVQLEQLLPNLTPGERSWWVTAVAVSALDLIAYESSFDTDPSPQRREDVRCAKVILRETAENAVGADCDAYATAPQRPEDCKRVIDLLAMRVVEACERSDDASLPTDDRIAATATATGLMDTAAAVGLLAEVQSRELRAERVLLLRWRRQLNPASLFTPASTVPTPGVQADGHPAAVGTPAVPGGPETAGAR